MEKTYTSYKKASCKTFLRLLITVICLQSFNINAQNAFLPLSNPVQSLYDPYINRVSSDMHTSIKPFLLKDVMANSPYDTINTPVIKDTPFTRSWVGRKLFREHFLYIEKEDYKLYLDPVLELTAGRDQDFGANYFYNSRGVWISGSIGKRFSFNTTFYENQGKFPYYLDSVITGSRIVPGQARIKDLGNNFDYAWATGTVNFELNKHFTFQFGHDKNFFGDGYRSLLLSDNAFNYPFFKVVTDIWKIRYVNVFAVLQDLQKTYVNDNEPFRKKYVSFHYLDLNIGKRASVGIYEAVIFHGDSTGSRGFDINYLNPIIFYRPVEFSVGSPDNVLLGINLKYKINNNNLLYGQLMLDEFLIKEVRASNGWWANKQGLQGGFKSFNVFGVKQLNLQGEFNYVRPYTYSHREPVGNYGHYRQPLAHPLGANFWEALGFANYTWRNINLSARVSYAEVGYDTSGANVGQNIFESYDTHFQEYNNEVGQGDKHKIIWAEFSVNYLINPVSRLSVFAEAALRSDDSVLKGKQSTVLIQGGIRTRLYNRYYDF